MAKDVNIHVKTTGTQQTTDELNRIAQATEEMGAKATRSTGWLKEAFTALVGPLGISAVVGFAVAGIQRFIAVLGDAQRASAQAVAELANQQRAAGSFFEAVNAYSGPQRKAALAQARGVQAATGLPFESTMQLLTAQQRAFGEINPQSTEQLAAYWQLHTPGTTSTVDLVRWMGESGIKTPEQQGKIMRMISAVAGQKGLTNEELITPLSMQGEKFRYLGWTPEQTIENLGKVIVPGEGTRGIFRLFTAMESFTPAEAVKMHAPSQVANNDQARWEFLRNKAAAMSPERRNEFLSSMFGVSAPAVRSLLFEPTSPELQQAIDYAASPQAAAEEAQRAAGFRGTAEGTLEQAKGGAGQFDVNISREAEILASIREYGQKYLEFLKRENSQEYVRLKMLNWPGGGEEGLINTAAVALWQKGQSPEAGLIQNYLAKPVEQRLSDIEHAAQTINHFHYEHVTNYYPIAGTSSDRDIGPRVDRDFR